jgi:phosphohistidine phosphatase
MTVVRPILALELKIFLEIGTPNVVALIHWPATGEHIMKTLLILRHAKSSWDDASLDDHERPLNKRGLRTAPLMGQLIADERIVPDCILSSTAKRARETAFLVGKNCGFLPSIEIDPQLYPSSAAGCIDVLTNLPDDVSTLLLVAHNPGLERLVEVLTGTFERLPTAALVQLSLEIDDWADLDASVATTLVNLWRPRELF